MIRTNRIAKVKLRQAEADRARAFARMQSRGASYQPNNRYFGQETKYKKR